jgi:hypothetical protein
MEHTKKMVVVPQELVERLREGTPAGSVGGGSGKTGLDAEMNRILNDKRLDDSEKWKQYQQVLHRFLHFSANRRHGITLPIVEQQKQGVKEEQEETAADGSDVTADRARRESAALVEELVETVPKIYRTEARNLLRFMSRTTPVTWDAKGAVYVNGQKVPSSNIVDVLHGVVRARRTDRLPPGWTEVMGALKDANVPKEYVSNPAALRFLGVGLDTASSPWSTPSPRATPMRERLRQRPPFARPTSPRPAVRRKILKDVDEEGDYDDDDELEGVLSRWEQLPT